MFFKSTVIYLVGDILNKMIPFLMIPILTAYLSKADYGMISFYTVIVSFFIIFTGNGMTSFIGTYFYKFDSQIRKKYISNILMILGFFTIIVSLIIYIFQFLILTYIELSLFWLIIALFISSLQFVITLYLTICIYEKEVKQYIIIQIIQSIFLFLSVYIFIVYLNFDWTGYIWALALTNLIFGLYSILLLIKQKYLLLNISLIKMKEIIKFSIPLIPHLFTGWANNSIDRLLILTILGLSSVGLYGISFQIASSSIILIMAINKVWSPYIYEKLSRTMSFDEKIQVIKTTYKAMFGFIFIICVAFMIISIGFPYFVNEEFLESQKIFNYLYVAFTLQGLYYFVVPYLYVKKRTKTITKISLISLLLHLVLSYIFIKYIGLIGVSIAVIISYLFLFVATLIVSNKVYPMPWALNIITKRL